MIMKGSRQSTNTVLMVAPTHFCLNEEAALDNKFMNSGEKLGVSAKNVTAKAVEEFEALVANLRSHGVDVNVYYPPPPTDGEPFCPDAVFPNNWFSTHTSPETKERTLVLYPMKVHNRRLERKPELIADIEGEPEGAGVIEGSIVSSPHTFARKIDLSHLEKDEEFLEGTGGLVIDRVNRVVYAAISDRTHKKVLDQWKELLGYEEIVAFTSSDAQGTPIYHTNVMMAIGSGWAVVCSDSVENPQEREHFLAALGKHHEVVCITRDQVNKFCGNILEVRDGQDRPVIAMSSQAYNAFTEEQRRILLKHVHELVHTPIPVIETVGGGGVRCSLAEIFY